MDIPSQSPDFVVVDDDGDFAYLPSEAVLLSRFEYPEQAVCILDRRGNNYDLEQDPDGPLTLGRSLGKADLEWLRQAWKTVCSLKPRDYPLVRPVPSADQDFIEELFVTLQLISSDGKLSAGKPRGFWTVIDAGATTPMGSLREVIDAVGRRRNPTSVTVSDPDGRHYRVAEVSHPGLAGRIGRHKAVHLVQTWPL